MIKVKSLRWDWWIRGGKERIKEGKDTFVTHQAEKRMGAKQTGSY